MYVVW